MDNEESEIIFSLNSDREVKVMYYSGYILTWLEGGGGYDCSSMFCKDIHHFSLLKDNA